MTKKIMRSWLPINIVEKANGISEPMGLSKVDGFRIINGIMPDQILSIKKIRQPKSKKVFLQIDTRRIMKL